MEAINNLNKITDLRNNMISYIVNSKATSKMSDKQYDALENKLLQKSFAQLKKEYDILKAKNQMKNGGGVEWDKDSDSIRTELGEFRVRITPQMQKGYYDVYVSANKKEIGKKYDVYGIDNAKDIALEMISNSNKFDKGSTVKGEEKSTYKYYKVPNEQLWAIQECNSVFEDGWGSTCVVIGTRKSEAQAIDHVKHLTKLQLEADSKYKNGGGIDINELNMPVIRTQFEDEEYEFKDGGNVKVGDKVMLPEIKMRDGKIQFEKVENGEVLYIENGIYGVLNPKTKRIHQVSLNQIKFENGGTTKGFCYTIGGL